MKLEDMSDEELVLEYAGECESLSRWISGDPPLQTAALFDEIMRRLKAAKQ